MLFGMHCLVLGDPRKMSFFITFSFVWCLFLLLSVLLHPIFLFGTLRYCLSSAILSAIACFFSTHALYRYICHKCLKVGFTVLSALAHTVYVTLSVFVLFLSVPFLLLPLKPLLSIPAFCTLVILLLFILTLNHTMLHFFVMSWSKLMHFHYYWTLFSIEKAANGTLVKFYCCQSSFNL